MSEEAIFFCAMSMKIDALEEILDSQQREKYRGILQGKKENFIKVWGKYLTSEQLEEALVDFDA